MNIVIAAILFLLTSLSLYVVWYIVRGHSKKMKRLSRTEADRMEKGTPNEEAQGGNIPKDSYCYPKINDIMGYPFISVVRVPQELISDASKTDREPEWGGSESIGLKAVPAGKEEKEVDEDEPWLNEDRDRVINQWNQGNKGREATPPSPADEHETVDLGENVSGEDVEMLDQLGSMTEWTNRDFADSIPDDELNAVINNNGDLIDQPELTDEDYRTAQEAEALQRMRELEERNIQTEGMGNLGAEFMSMLDDEDEDEDEDGGQIDENDIPAI